MRPKLIISFQIKQIMKEKCLAFPRRYDLHGEIINIKLNVSYLMAPKEQFCGSTDTV